jgi:hypothetical protein
MCHGEHYAFLTKLTFLAINLTLLSLGTSVALAGRKNQVMHPFHPHLFGSAFEITCRIDLKCSG